MNQKVIICPQKHINWNIHPYNFENVCLSLHDQWRGGSQANSAPLSIFSGKTFPTYSKFRGGGWYPKWKIKNCKIFRKLGNTRKFSKRSQNCQKIRKIKKLFEEVTTISEIEKIKKFCWKRAEFLKDEGKWRIWFIYSNL